MTIHTDGQPEKKGQGSLLAEWVNTLGQTVQRTVDSTGKIVERTLDTTGKALNDKPAGSLLDLPVISQTTNAEGQPTKQVRDTTGAIIEYTVVKGQIINTRVVTPAPAKHK